MTVVTGTTIGLPFGRPLTADDLEQLPEDGHRYELIDGTLLVTPSPMWQHQAAALDLAVLLRAACPSDLRVITAPFDWKSSDATVIIPDVLVARYADLVSVPGYQRLLAPPLLAVEVLSPSTALVDLNLKRAAYERAGVPSYWVVRPDPDATAVTVFELGSDRRYTERTVVGDDEVVLERPYPMRFVPERLTDDLRPR